MVNSAVVIKLIINQGYKQFSAFLWDWFSETESFPFFKGGAGVI